MYIHHEMRLGGKKQSGLLLYSDGVVDGKERGVFSGWNWIKCRER